MEEKDWSRLRIVTIPYRMLVEILRGNPDGDARWSMITSITCVEGLPEDALILAHSEDISRRGVSLRVWSSEFDPVPEGNLIPSLELKLRRKELI